MKKSKPGNTKDQDLEKIKKILGQCYKDAKNTVERINKFRQSNRSQIRQKNYANAFQNFYENNLLEKVDYKEVQSSYQKVMQFVEELLKFISNQKIPLMKSMTSCLKEINKCSNTIESYQKNSKYFYFRRGYKQEESSINKCVQHLGLIHQSLVDLTKKLQEAQTILSKVQQQQRSKQRTKVESNYVEESTNLSQDQKKALTEVKSALQTIITEMETFCTKQLPKKSSYQLKQNSRYAYLKNICSEMLRQATDFINSGYMLSQWVNFHCKLKRVIADCRELCEEIMKKKYLFNQSLEEIENHFTLIKVEFQKINQLPIRIKKLSGINQEIWNILESTADIKFGLNKILEDSKNTQNQDCDGKLNLLLLIRDRSTFIQQKTLKLLEEIGNKKQDHSEVENTVKIQTLYTQSQFEEGVQIKLEDFRQELQKTHQKQMQELHQQYNQQIQQLQNQINVQKQELYSKTSKLKPLQNQNSQNSTKLNQLSIKDQELTKIKNQLYKINQLRQCKRKLSETEQQLYQSKQQSSTNSQKITQLQQLLDKQINQKKALQTTLQKKKSQYHNQLTALNFKVDKLKNPLVQKQGELSQQKQQLSQLKEIFTNVSSVLEKKINKKELKLDELVDVIQNYNPPVGMKLIISHVIHGQDQQRSQIIAAIEKFSKKTIKRTDLLCRYPDAKSILHQLKDANNFAFIFVFKTTQGTIFGSYSEGLRKPTFMFSFTPSVNNYASDVKFYIPENPSVKIASVELFQGRYLQYGAGQLRLNCLELATISAKSDVKGESYYGLDWREVMNENSEEKVPLSEVEMHKVQFEVKVTNESEQKEI